MQEKNRFEGVQKRTFEADAGGVRIVDNEKRIVELSFSSEMPVKRYGANEILSHEKNAVMLERINATGCLLFNHNRDKVVGKIIEAKIENKRGVARVQFDTDEESEIIYNKVQNGTLRGVSVGYCIHEYLREVTGKDEELQVTYTVTRWEPTEISIVSVPADISVGVGRSIEKNGVNSFCNLFGYQLKVNKNRENIRRRLQ